MEWTAEPVYVVTMTVAFVVIVMLIWIIRINTKLKKLRKQYLAVMDHTGVQNLEEVLIELKQGLAGQKNTSDKLYKQLEVLESIIPRQKSKLGIFRYNAFNEGGSDLSFSIAILNEEKDGAVLTSIHSRENSYVYAKPIDKGESKYPLTPEERKVIQEAK